MKKLFLYLVCLITLPLSSSYAESYALGGGADEADDSYMKKDAPTTNYSSENNLQIRRDDTDIGQYRAVLSWGDILKDSLVGRSVDACTLFVHSYENDNATFEIGIYGLLRDFTDDEVTWNEYKTDSSWGTSGADNTTNDRTSTMYDIHTGSQDTIVGSWFAFDVTALVQTWDGDDYADAHGFIIAPAVGTTNWTTFKIHAADNSIEGYRPQLKVVYSGGGGGDNDPPDIHDLFSALMVRNLDPDSVTLAVSAVDSTDYDTTEIRYGTTMPSNQTNGSRLWAGGSLENDTSVYLLSVTQPDWVYFKIFSGDEVPNWSSGVGDSIYFPGCGSGSGSTKNIMHDRIISIQEAVNR